MREYPLPPQPQDRPTSLAPLRRGCGGLQAIHGACPRLATVDAQFCNVLDQEGLRRLCGCAPGLISLLLPYCTSITCAALGALSGAGRLHTLDLSFTSLQVPVRSQELGSMAHISRRLHRQPRTAATAWPCRSLCPPDGRKKPGSLVAVAGAA